MKYFKWVVLLTFSSTNLMAQFVDTIQLKKNPIQKTIKILTYGDKAFMELHPNGKIYQFKSGLEDGKYVAFFKEVNLKKKLNTDTAMLAVIKNGEINGLLQRWDNIDHKLAEECEYVNGRKTGFRKLYYITDDGIKLVNIERWENDVHQQDIFIEW